MFDLSLAQIPDVNLTNIEGGWCGSKSSYRRGRSMPPANDTSAPISVTSNQAWSGKTYTQRVMRRKHETRGRQRKGRDKNWLLISVCLCSTWYPSFWLEIVSRFSSQEWEIWGAAVRQFVCSFPWGKWRQAPLRRMTNVVWLLLYKLFIPGKRTPVSAKL